MDHHSGHSGMDMDMPADACSMNMLFTWSTTNLCIIFPSWQIRGPLSLVLSLLAIVALTAGYEAVRDISRRYEAATSRWGGEEQERSRDGYSDRGRDNADDGAGSLLWQHVGRARTPTPGQMSSGARRRGSKTVRAALYAVQVFYSFFIMLLFMTYNGWVMFAVTVGAFLGYMMFGSNGVGSSTKSVACH